VPDRPFLSLSMIVKNEAANLDACLRSAKALCDELVVIDTGSSDRTVEIARSHGASVFHFAWCDDFAAARNFALDHTSGEWVLHLDADETAVADSPDALRVELAAQPAAVRFLRVPVRSPWPDGLGSDEHTARRLFRRLPSVRWTRRIHENITVRLLTRDILENPNDAVPHFYLAREYASQGESATALQICKQILAHWGGRMLPAFEDAIRCQAMRSATACGDAAQAVELGKPGEERAEGSELPFLLGRAYLQDGQLDAAERNLERALGFAGTANPFQTTEGTGTWRPLLELGTLAWRRGDGGKAADHWRAAVASAPELPAVRFAAGKGLLAIGRAAEAVEHLTRALELMPELHEAHLRLSEAELQLGDTQAAYDRLERLVGAHPERPEHWHWLGSLLCQVDEVEAAAEVLGQAIELHQEHAGIYLALGTALQKLGRHEDALNAFALASALDPASEVARAGVTVAAYHQSQVPGGR
jgi:tetratricopeptide (TPR) repeat protein